jgi:hypothetical protein
LSSKDKKPKPEKGVSKPDPAPEKATPPGKEPEVILPKNTLPPALAPSPKPKKEKEPVGLWGILLVFFLIVAGGVGAGGYYLYQKQMKFQNETLARLSQLETQLSAMDTESDQARKNQQSIDNLNLELQQYKTAMDTTLKSHQSSLTTLDEDVMRLKEKVAAAAEAPPLPPSNIDVIGTEAGPLPGELPPESQGEETLKETAPKEDDASQESQKFVEWMENFFAAIWNWLAGLFN